MGVDPAQRFLSRIKVGLVVLAQPEEHGPGDPLGGVGNTQKDAARFSSLLTGVQTKVFDRLPDETWVYPGHGTDTTLGAERPRLEEWRERG